MLQILDDPELEENRWYYADEIRVFAILVNDPQIRST